MLKEENGELRLEITGKNNKPKIYIQRKVPLRKAIEYTDGVIALHEDAKKAGLPGTNERDLLDYQVRFIANLFDDDDVTAELLYENLDTNERKFIEDIIIYRVLGNLREESDQSEFPK
ncbi:phage tail assembly chaperone G [uncultured Enterococcus sp.]|uniref:phage tail assembly chaperone G n=1 Tax=uncultured Enterococcus sp. TaxID=167972 RepID=UPI002AA5FAFE|nr:hypothetical protein [uncultured Enterococcus sp.]